MIRVNLCVLVSVWCVSVGIGVCVVRVSVCVVCISVCVSTCVYGSMYVCVGV